MKCYKCGQLLPEDSEFCQYCGEKIENEKLSQEEIVEEKEEEVVDNTTDVIETVPVLDEIASEKEIIEEVEIEREQKNAEKSKKIKTKYCSRCGSAIDYKTKKCTGCGKQYFKGIKFNKFSTTVLILSVVILASIILNIVQTVKINELNKAKEYWYGEYTSRTDDYNKKVSELKKKEQKSNNVSETKTTQKQQSVQSAVQNTKPQQTSKRTCISVLCENEVSGTSSYCFEHKCYWPDCNFGRNRGGYYCSTHTCNDVGCNNPVVGNYKSYCQNHTCYYPGCTSGQSFNSVYCLRHK